MFKLILLVVVSYCAVVESRTVCYDGLGCFTDDHPFSWTIQRPIAFLPDTPEKVGTKFRLYTRQNQNEPEIIRYDSLGSFYDPYLPTKFIVHGFLHNGIKKWVLDMKDAFLKVGDYNVIGVDWSKGNGPSYTQATANTQIVGAEIARFVNTMVEKYGVSADDFHVIGHSLGSHIAGYAGERIKGLGRITGLDPAGPYFENTPPQVRLDPTDAKFVEAIHTDGTAHLLLGLGLMQPVGHADFYPNGGKDQPECPATSGKILGAIFNGLLLDIEGIEDTLCCSHMAAVYFFTNSIVNNECSFHGYPCSKESDFEAGKCVRCSSKGCNKMGYWASAKHDHGTLYLNTQPPLGKDFCKQNYGVVLGSGKIDKQNQARGQFTIYFESANGHRSSVEYLDNDKNTFKSNSIEHRLISLDNPFNHEISRVFISYKKTTNWASSWLYDNRWAFTFVEIHGGNSQKTKVFCQSTVAINSGQTVEFYRC